MRTRRVQNKVYQIFAIDDDIVLQPGASDVF